MYGRKNIRTKKCTDEKISERKKCTDERMHRRKIVETKKCETKISKYEKMGDEKERGEKIFRRKTADEKQQTKKCQMKKCQTKNGHGIWWWCRPRPYVKVLRILPALCALLPYVCRLPRVRVVFVKSVWKCAPFFRPWNPMEGSDVVCSIYGVVHFLVNSPTVSLTDFVYN